MCLNEKQQCGSGHLVDKKGPGFRAFRFERLIHRYLMNSIYLLMQDKQGDFADIADQMQEFMRTFDPAAAPGIFASEGHTTGVTPAVLWLTCGPAMSILERTKVP